MARIRKAKDGLWEITCTGCGKTKWHYTKEQIKAAKKRQPRCECGTRYSVRGRYHWKGAGKRTARRVGATAKRR